MSKQVRVRFAPSPTGFLHVGGARTALFNWLWAKKNNGKFILRIEDTDTERSTDASTNQILESMKWLGLDWDEGPFYQSERREIYQEHLEKLRKEGKIYPAFETREELDQMRQEAEEAKRDFIYDRRSLNLSAEEVEKRLAQGVPFVWRFKTPDDGYTDVAETLLGGDKCRFENARIDDFIITRPGTLEKTGMPLYNFVVVIDDALMEITHVIRGADHLNNTAKQVLIYEAFGYDVPTFTHLPLIMKNKKKMSKRDADADPRYPVSVSARRDLGYLPEAAMNFLALLGWSFPNDQEFFSKGELIENFNLDRLIKSNANFDEDKFNHINGLYIRNLPAEDIITMAKPFLAKAGYTAEDKGDSWLDAIIRLVIERCTLLSEFPDALSFFFNAPTEYDPKGIKKGFLKVDTAAQSLRECADVLESLEAYNEESIESAIRGYCDTSGIGFGKVAQPIRIAVTGRMASPGLFEVLANIPASECAARMKKAADLIESGAFNQD